MASSSKTLRSQLFVPSIELNNVFYLGVIHREMAKQNLQTGQSFLALRSQKTIKINCYRATYYAMVYQTIERKCTENSLYILVYGTKARLPTENLQPTIRSKLAQFNLNSNILEVNADTIDEIPDIATITWLATEGILRKSITRMFDCELFKKETWYLGKPWIFAKNIMLESLPKHRQGHI